MNLDRFTADELYVRRYYLDSPRWSWWDFGRGVAILFPSFIFAGMAFHHRDWGYMLVAYVYIVGYCLWHMLDRGDRFTNAVSSLMAKYEQQISKLESELAVQVEAPQSAAADQ
ncbi:MAG TPA: hypothetical protein PKC18_01385 [Lacipirellulaceae bacterium]|nr:hypothetical protein [Lacipirellulaceae bacterium]HMP04976.1 hypothetical protein [Lacipirellulaceae bacterium]